MSEHKYKLKYDLKTEPGEWTKEHIKETGSGGTDAFVMFSIIYPADGSLSVQNLSVDGRNNGDPLPDNEIFKLWTMLAQQLGESETLTPGKKAFAADVFETFRLALLAHREYKDD